MQGRLSAPVPGRLQAFPWSSWRDEFDRARACGLEAIEWLFEAERFDENPLWTQTGVNAINRGIRASGIPVSSVCADYFMVHPFFRVSRAERAESVRVLERLIVCAAGVGARTVLIPVLEVSEIRTTEEGDMLLEALRGPCETAGRAGIRLGLETELPATEFLALVENGGHSSLGVYYDTGNAAAKGFAIESAIAMLGTRLVGVHVKDRPLAGTSVPLGRGAADFAPFFDALREARYAGPVILQSTSGENYLGAARAHLAFVRRFLAAARPPPL